MYCLKSKLLQILPSKLRSVSLSLLALKLRNSPGTHPPAGLANLLHLKPAKTPKKNSSVELEDVPNHRNLRPDPVTAPAVLDVQHLPVADVLLEGVRILMTSALRG